jgi:hypothetical protein
MSRRTLAVGAVVLVAVAVAVPLAGCGGRDRPAGPTSPAVPGGSPPGVTDEGPDLFEDVTARSGVVFSYRNGEEVDPPHLSILESLGGGLAAFDFDGDGLLDLFLVGGGHFGGKDNQDILGHPCKLFRNTGGFKFEDVTDKAGLTALAGDKPWFYSHAAAAGDFDNDGFPDLLVTGYRHVALLHNVPDGKGGRKFEDVTAKAGLDKGVTWATSAGWADFDGDGFADLYVCQYVDWRFGSPRTHPTDCFYSKDENNKEIRDVCPPKKFDGLQALVFRNTGGGAFENVTATAGIKAGGPGVSKGLGVVVVDVNADGKPDVYAANDTVPNFLYVNKSTRGKILFEELGMQAGVALDGGASPNGSMGTDAGDPFGSGKPSLFCTNYENELHALYDNASTRDRAFFIYSTPRSGMAALGQKFVGWGTGFVDLDHDGWEDVVIANGHAIRYPKTADRSQKPVIMRNVGEGQFRIASGRGGSYFTKPHLGRGIALADFDNDGKVDVAICNTNEPVAVLRNVAPAGNHWAGFTLKGAKNADVVGARVRLTAGGKTQTRFAKGGGSYASTPDRRLVFGLGTADKIDKLTVEWPDGSSQDFSGVPTDKYLVLTQGEKEPKPAK